MDENMEQLEGVTALIVMPQYDPSPCSILLKRYLVHNTCLYPLDRIRACLYDPS